MEKELYSSRIIRVYLNLLKTKYQQVDPADLLEYAGIKPYQVSDDACWFTQRQVDRFNERVVHLTGNPGIAREGGRYAARGSVGFIGKYVLGLIGPANAFFTINKSSSSFTRSSRFEARRLGANKMEITVTPLPDVQERAFQCENRIGFFEAVLDLFNCSLPSIEHPECLFRGGNCCRYVVSWRGGLPTRLRAARNYLALILPPSLFLLHPLLSVPLAAVTPTFLCVLLALTLQANRIEKRELQAALSNLKESTDELLEQTTHAYDNALTVNEVGQAISKQMDKEEMLLNIINALEHRLGYDRGMILLADRERTALRFSAGFGYDEEQLEVLREVSFRLDNPDSKGIFVTCFREKKPFLINDFSRIASLHSPQSVDFARLIGARAFVCCAIVCEGESLGVLAMDNVRSKRELVGSDLSLLMGVAPVIGMSIRNAFYVDRERRLAEQLRQSQKMEAVGELSSGIAHDFNNLLTAIIGFTTLAQGELAKESQPFQYLGEVLLTSQRASYLTRGLLSFGRKQSSNPEPVDLNEIVRRMEKLLRRLISRQIELDILLHEAPLTVMADPGQIDQIIMNLATNARDAMTGAGTITIETSAAEVSLPPGDAPAGEGRGLAALKVRDTGRGMDAETRQRLFEPFYTTKPAGKGTGLGLSIVHGIVLQHGGTIDVVSAPGEGTSFIVSLPLLKSPPPAAAAGDEAELNCAGTETVLVAEDAPEVRRVTVELLRRHGYRVIAAADGREAVDRFLAHRDEIDLVVMDLIMPAMTGSEAFAAMIENRPGVKVLFTSAYPPEEAGLDGALAKQAAFLAKPSAPRALLRAIRAQLAR